MVGFRVRTPLRAGFTPRQALPPARPPSRPLPWPVLPLTSSAPARPPPGPRGDQSAAGGAGAPRRRRNIPRHRRSGPPSMAPRCGPRGAGDGRGQRGLTGGGRGRARYPNLWPVPAGGPGCDRGGGASWTCSPPWSCCSGSARRPQSQVRPAGTRECSHLARPPPAALCAGLWQVPGGDVLTPGHLGFGPGGGPALPTRAGGPRGAVGGWMGSGRGRVPERPATAIHSSTTGVRATWARLGLGERAGLGMVRASCVLRPSCRDQTSATLRGSWCARRTALRAEGQ